MKNSSELPRDTRIKREVSRLRRILKKVPEVRQQLAIGLVERAAFLRVELEDLEADINKNGTTEVYQPSEDSPPITRIRAAAQQYDKLVKSYTTVCRQIDDLVPQGGKPGEKVTAPSDALQNLIQSRAEGRMRRVK
ncbi:MAG TPA: hypothetical protein VD969_19600 [Symbiobacteriaceae bacterium]|nr:hypothetical protein [Symbiobacteriaceae bacterium]